MLSAKFCVWKNCFYKDQMWLCEEERECRLWQSDGGARRKRKGRDLGEEPEWLLLLPNRWLPLWTPRRQCHFQFTPSSLPVNPSSAFLIRPFLLLCLNFPLFPSRCLWFLGSPPPLCVTSLPVCLTSCVLPCYNLIWVNHKYTRSSSICSIQMALGGKITINDNHSEHVNINLYRWIQFQ